MPSGPTCRLLKESLRQGTPASIVGMESVIALMQREWTASPDSAQLGRGTGYSMRLGTGTLDLRLFHRQPEQQRGVLERQRQPRTCNASGTHPIGVRLLRGSASFAYAPNTSRAVTNAAHNASTSALSLYT